LITNYVNTFNNTSKRQRTLLYINDTDTNIKSITSTRKISAYQKPYINSPLSPTRRATVQRKMRINDNQYQNDYISLADNMEYGDILCMQDWDTSTLSDPLFVILQIIFSQY
jgi:hypothetical protein